MLKKVPFTTLLLVALLFAGMSSSQAQVVIFNEEFDYVGDFGDWGTSGTATFSIDNTGQLTGDNSMKVEIVDGGANPWSISFSIDMPLQKL